MYKRLIQAMLLVIMMLVLPTALLAQGTDPVSIVQASTKLFNAGDYPGSLAYWADDATVKLNGVPPGQPDSFKGKDQILAWYKSLSAVHFQIQEEPIKVEGDTATFKASSTSDQTRQLGLASLDATEVYTVQNGKITSLTWTITPESAAKLQAAVAASAPPTAPQTGGEPFSIYTVISVLGGLAILSGIGLALYKRKA